MLSRNDTQNGDKRSPESHTENDRFLERKRQDKQHPETVTQNEKRQKNSISELKRKT